MNGFYSLFSPNFVERLADYRDSDTKMAVNNRGMTMIWPWPALRYFRCSHREKKIT
jgi:hypothetical protein